MSLDIRNPRDARVLARAAAVKTQEVSWWAVPMTREEWREKAAEADKRMNEVTHCYEHPVKRGEG